LDFKNLLESQITDIGFSKTFKTIFENLTRKFLFLKELLLGETSITIKTHLLCRHHADQFELVGLLIGTQTFVNERGNKILKEINTNANQDIEIRSKTLKILWSISMMKVDNLASPSITNKKSYEETSKYNISEIMKQFYNITINMEYVNTCTSYSYEVLVNVGDFFALKSSSTKYITWLQVTNIILGYQI